MNTFPFNSVISSFIFFSINISWFILFKSSVSILLKNFFVFWGSVMLFGYVKISLINQINPLKNLFHDKLILSKFLMLKL